MPKAEGKRIAISQGQHDSQIMRSRFHFVFVVFCLTAVSVLTVYLRSADNHVFYKLCSTNAEQDQLKQRL